MTPSQNPWGTMGVTNVILILCGSCSVWAEVDGRVSFFEYLMAEWQCPNCFCKFYFEPQTHSMK